MKIPINKIRIAHRGLYGSDLLENTISTFKRCIEGKIPIELDVHMLKDDTLVVFHDDDLKRMCHIDKKLKDMTWEELQTIDLKNGEKIPSFLDVLKLVDGQVLLDIEIKTDVGGFKILRNLSRMLDDYEGPFLVKSFNPLYMIWFRLFRSHFQRGILVSKLKGAKLPKAFKYMLFHMWFNFLIKPDFIAFNKNDLPNKRVDKYRKKGVPVILWTCDTEDKIIYDGIIFEKK